MGRGLRQLARQARCPRCGYDVAGLDPRATCPECGIDASSKVQLRRNRAFARTGWLQAYWIIALVAALPLATAAINIVAAMGFLGSRPSGPGWRHVETGEFPILDITMALTMLGFLGSVLLWPFMLLLLASIAWGQWSERHHRTTPWSLWLPLPLPLALPVMIWVVMNLMIFPD